MQRTLTYTLVLAAIAAVAVAQIKPRKGNPQSPAREASVDIAGKHINISYCAPSVRGRKIFGPGGQVAGDPTYPVWRVGADEATTIHTDATLDFHGLIVPPGDYTIWAQVDKTPWQLIINKQVGQWGTEYDKSKDLGRIPMTIVKPAAPIETFKISLTPDGANRGKLTLDWENVSASAPFTVK